MEATQTSEDATRTPTNEPPLSTTAAPDHEAQLRLMETTTAILPFAQQQPQLPLPIQPSTQTLPQQPPTTFAPAIMPQTSTEEQLATLIGLISHQNIQQAQQKEKMTRAITAIATSVQQLGQEPGNDNFSHIC